jgi:hypothetical protein
MVTIIKKYLRDSLWWNKRKSGNYMKEIAVFKADCQVDVGRYNTVQLKRR